MLRSCGAPARSGERPGPQEAPNGLAADPDLRGNLHLRDALAIERDYPLVAG